MANQKVRNRSIDADIFKEYIKNLGISLKDISAKTDINEKTLKRCLDEESMSIGIVMDICHLLDENAFVLFGDDSSQKWMLSIGYLVEKERRH